MTLDGQKVIVVGGSSGIGRGAARALLGRGAHVVLVGRSLDKLERASLELGGAPRVGFVAADVSKEDQVASMFGEVGRFDHLVVTIGIPPPAAPIGSFDLDAARQFVDTMILGAVRLAKHAQRNLRVGGSITFTSGISGDRPPIPGGSVVSAVAGSLGYFARALARELGPTRVNVVSPGWVETEMWDAIAGESKTAVWAEMAKRLPAGRIAKPDDIAPAYVFLLESELTTGVTLRVDGGHSLV